MFGVTTFILMIAGLVLPFQPPSGKSEASEYVRQVQQSRAQRDKDYLDPKKSDLDPADIPEFKGLSYFPVNPAYKVTARFVRTENEKKFQMPTSDGKFRTYLKYGELKFRLAKRELTLAVYQSERLAQTEEYKDYLLVPFKDQTAGYETYKGGRYIDFTIPKTEQVTLDFNLAYNPSCAYATRFSCPVVPGVNHLDVSVHAGEKAYVKGHDH